MLFDDLPEVSSAAKVNHSNETQTQKPTSSLFDDLPSPSKKAPYAGKEDASKPNISQSAETSSYKELKEPYHSITGPSAENKGPSLDFLPATLRKRKKSTKSAPPQIRNVAVTENNKVLNIHADSSIVFENHQVYEESRNLSERLASIMPSDMYVPSIPNDYLAYKQKRENDKMRADLEIQVKKTREMQEKLRLQIQEERQKAVQSGNYDEIIQSRLSTSTSNLGRGRGVNNLPAWLLKKQKEKEQDHLQMS